jgi:hypothetical protein
MAVSAQTLIARTRRYVRDYPKTDSLTASAASNATSLTVADTSLYAVGWMIQVDDGADVEAVEVKALASGTQLTVGRAAAGIPPAGGVTHATDTPILIRPKWFDTEILDALNYAIWNTYPYIYKEILAAPTETANDQRVQFTVPELVWSSDTVYMPHVASVEFKDSGDATGDFYPVRHWRVRRGSGNHYIEFYDPPTTGTSIRIRGYGPFEYMIASGNLDSEFPLHAQDLLVVGAAEYLLSSGEAGRVAIDVGVIDQREQANRVGSSMSAANALQSRFERMLYRHAMPPLSRHRVPSL